MTLVPPPDSMDRRSFLGVAAGTAAGLALLAAQPTRALAATPSPFLLGVASGDPLPNGVVLWTRLARDLSDPTGGMGTRPVRVRWEVATDPRMRRIVRKGDATARPDHAHTVHVDVRGLKPGREYWYRFRSGGTATEPARTLTAPARDARGGELTIAQVSCQRMDHGAFAAYADIAAAAPDVVTHLGDYIYEYPITFGQELTDLPVDLADYRLRYARYKQDPELQKAHAIAPFVVTWDDHEVENNYTGLVPQEGSVTPDRASFTTRRAAAYQAWWEHQPVRMRAPRGPNLTIFRRLEFGRLATLHVLDSRQYRTDQSCSTNDIGPRCEGADGAAYTVLGSEQERWVRSSTHRTSARWNVMLNQVVMQQWRFAPGNAVWNLDQWDGYPAARDRMVHTLDRGKATPIVLTGDVHSSWVGSLARDFDDPDADPIGTEFVGPAVTSAPSALLASTIPTVLENSPQIRWADGTERGWVRHTVTAKDWDAEYRFLPDPFDPAVPAQVARRWHVDPRSTLSEV